MIEVRRSDDRGHFDFGWLNTYHSFSFADYYDPSNLHFGPLRVLNEDFIKPGQGFGTHGHQDMEIVTYVLSGVLAHKDSTGGNDEIKAGEVQRMTAGSGIRHSEFNGSNKEGVHLLQVWFLPEKTGLPPGYEQKDLVLDSRNRLAPVVAKNPAGHMLRIHQDIIFNVCNLDEGKKVETEIKKGRLGYLHNTMNGTIHVNKLMLKPGDGLKITGPEKILVTAKTNATFVLFDMVSL
jgi:redox-sensitive bicupin YhaK (pirin superfamily)